MTFLEYYWTRPLWRHYSDLSPVSDACQLSVQCRRLSRRCCSCCCHGNHDDDNDGDADGRFRYVQSSSSLNYTERSAVGVAALVSPWNLPLYLLTFKMAPALACGNTIVCKPSEMTSVTAWMLCRLISQAGARYHGNRTFHLDHPLQHRWSQFVYA